MFGGDFKTQHTPMWWKTLFETSGLLQVSSCEELKDAEILYEDLTLYEDEHHIDPFDVEILLQQLEWQRTNRPRKSLFTLTAKKL